MTIRLVDNDAALIGQMTQRCVDRGCECDIDAQLISAESCLEFRGEQRLEAWCDMCLMSAAINSLELALEKAGTPRVPNRPKWSCSSPHEGDCNVACGY